MSNRDDYLSEDYLDRLEDGLREMKSKLDSRKERLEDDFMLYYALDKLREAYEEKCNECEAKDDKIRELQHTIKKQKEEIGEKDMKLSELGKLANRVAEKSDYEDLNKGVRKYLNMSKNKSPQKKGYIRTFVLEIYSTNKIPIPDDILEILNSFDDENGSDVTNNFNGPVGQVTM